MADELITPVKTLITGLKVEVKTTLLEATMENLERAVPLSKLTNTGTGVKKLSVGSGQTLQEFSIGLQGPGPGGDYSRVLALYRANVISASTQSYGRKDAAKLAITFNCLSDSRQATTDDVYDAVDFNAGS